MIALLLALAAQASDIGEVVQDHNNQRVAVERRASVVLVGWGATSVVAGTVGTIALEDEARAFSEMTIAWGAVNLLIGAVNLHGMRDKPRTYTIADTLRRDAALERIYWINAGADVAYLAIGSLVFLHGRQVDDPLALGFGAAIVVQGWFLLGYDVVNAMSHAGRHRRFLLRPVIQEHLGVGVSGEF